MARRTLVEWKASFAGFKLALFLARSRASVAAFNEGRASLGFFGCRNLDVIVKRRRGYKEAVVGRQVSRA